MLRSADKRLFLNAGLRDIPRGGFPTYGHLADAYIAAVLADSPRVFWTLQEASGNPQDMSGNDRHATTVTGTPTYREAGPRGYDYGVLFGTGQYIERSSVVSTATDNVTFEAWIYDSNDGQKGDIAQNGVAGTDGWGPHESGTPFRLIYYTSGVFGTSGPSIPDAVWSHIALKRTAGAWTPYVNGVAGSSLGSTAITTPTTRFRIAQSGAHGSLKLAYVALYDTALSTARINAHYTAAGF